MSLAPILPYITWGLIWDPQNKRGIPDSIYKVFETRRGRISKRKLLASIIIKENKKEEDISLIIYMKIKQRKLKKTYNYKRWPIEMVWL